MAQHQPQQPLFFGKEVSTVLVFRFRFMFNNHLAIRCQLLANREDVDPTAREYRENQFNMDSPVDCYARIPALMLFCAPKDAQFGPRMTTFFVDHYRHQFGSHLVISSYDGDIREVKIYWDGVPRKEAEKAAHTANQRRYTIRVIPVTCVYPCNIPVDQSPRLCFGLVFTSKLNGHKRRTYAREDMRVMNLLTQQPRTDIYKPSEFSFDLLDNFIDPGQYNPNADPNQEHYKNDSLFRSDHKMALYVCRGAKLIVQDERYPDFSRGHTRSLFQSGCVVVFTARRIQFEHSISTTGGSQNYRRDWDEFLPDHTLSDARVNGWLDEFELKQDPKDSNPPAHIIQKKASRVIFLGAVHSQFNTVCYNVCINRDTRIQDENYVALNMPEGAYIEDISSWNAGFAQIYARHRYERLFGTLVSPHMTQPFQVPADPYMQKRILGISDSGGEWGFPLVVNYDDQQIDVPQDYLEDRRDTDVRMYINDMSSSGELPRLMCRKSDAIEWFTAIPTGIDELGIPMLPPLYPPVLKEGNRLHYLTVGQKVNVVDGQVGQPNLRFQIDQEPERYELKDMDISSYGWLMWNNRNIGAVLVANQLDNEPDPQQTLIDREFKRISRDYWPSLKYYGPHPSGHLDLNHKGMCKSLVLVPEATPAPPPPQAPVMIGQEPGDQGVPSDEEIYYSDEDVW